MNYNAKIVRRLTFENWIWIVFIVISLMSIVGDELIKSSIILGDKKQDLLGKKLFTIVLIITLLIYLYFILRNYEDVKDYPNDNEYQVRLLGSLFIFVGAICLLYFQIKSTTVSDSVSI